MGNSCGFYLKNPDSETNLKLTKYAVNANPENDL